MSIRGIRAACLHSCRGSLARLARWIMATESTGINRPAITVCVILATLMQALDTTIANVALPHIQGSVSASQEQITWVLTSYIVAAAIMTPPTGFLASRFGQKRLFLVSVAGFTVTSMLCGLAQSAVQIVLFRILQGAFGAALVPLSQSVLMGINPKERQGSAMALFGMAVFLPDSERKPGEKLDWLGFGTLSIAIAALQVLLDRGEQKDWFGSGELWIEAIVAASAFYLFLVHTFTTNEPFIRPALFRDRNFLAGTLFIAIVGLTYYASLALQPPYLQSLMNYPVVTAGIVMGPRGVGTMIAMFVVGRLTGRLDTRVLLGTGLGLTAWAFYAMTGWTPDVSQREIVIVGLVQGVGLGFLFVPLSTVTLATLPPEQRTEGSGLYNLSRNIGSSVGISVVNALLTSNTQVNHAEIATHVTAVNRAFEQPSVAQFLNPVTEAGRAALDALVTRQAQIIAYIDDYKLLMIATLAVVPLLIVFKKSTDPSGGHAAVEL